jgi:hypothetical protein
MHPIASFRSSGSSINAASSVVMPTCTSFSTELLLLMRAVTVSSALTRTLSKTAKVHVASRRRHGGTAMAETRIPADSVPLFTDLITTFSNATSTLSGNVASGRRVMDVKSLGVSDPKS